jgi:hypothetical protein
MTKPKPTARFSLPAQSDLHGDDLTVLRRLEEIAFRLGNARAPRHLDQGRQLEITKAWLAMTPSPTRH